MTRYRIRKIGPRWYCIHALDGKGPAVLVKEYNRFPFHPEARVTYSLWSCL